MNLYVPFCGQLKLKAAAAAWILLLLWAADAALAVDRVSVEPGFNGTVRAISEPDSNGTRYVGGSFTAVDAYGTGTAGVTDLSSGAVNASFPKVTGSVEVAHPDGSPGPARRPLYTPPHQVQGHRCRGAELQHHGPRHQAADLPPGLVLRHGQMLLL